MQQELVNLVVYFYIFVCVALLFFNVVYIFYSKRKDIHQKKQTKTMKALQKELIEKIEHGQEWNEKEKKLLARRLKKISALLAFHDALELNREEIPKEKLNRFLVLCRPAIFELASVYSKYSAMERAFFAYFIAKNFGENAKQYQRMGETLLLYIPDSTIYCRENVLQALYALGAADALEQALLQFQMQGWYHHIRLIADGLLNFQGDKEQLARRLWKKNSLWEEYMKIAIIQFITNLSADFSDLMLSALKEESSEVCFAVIRYFQRHPVEEAKPLLIDIVEQNEDLAIAAVLALSSYPEEATKKVLKKAMNSYNWYIRRNAAMALLNIGLSSNEQDELCASEDGYAREMFTYVLDTQKRRSK